MTLIHVSIKYLNCRKSLLTHPFASLAYSLHSRLGDHLRSSLPRKASQPPSCFSSSDSEPNLRASHDPASAVSLTSSPTHLFTAHNAVAPTPIYTFFSLCLKCAPESHVAHFCTSFRSLFKCLIKETNLCKLAPVTVLLICLIF